MLKKNTRIRLYWPRLAHACACAALLLAAGRLDAQGIDSYCSTHSRVFTVVAHADDDLIFINPAISNAIQSGACVATVIVTGGYGYASTFELRIQGSLAAYAQMAKVAQPAWNQTWPELTVNNSSYTVRSDVLTLANGQTISLINMGLPSGWNNALTALPGSTSLYQLFATSSATAVSVVPQYAGVYNWYNLGLAVGHLIDQFQPTTVLTLNPDGAYPDDNVSISRREHPDHVMVATMTRNLVSARPWIRTFQTFATYVVDRYPANLSNAVGTAKNGTLIAYWQQDTYGGGLPQVENFAQTNQQCNALTPAELVWGYGEACKQYPHPGPTFNVGAQLVNQNTGHCLVAGGFVNLFVDCTASGVETFTIAQDGTFDISSFDGYFVWDGSTGILASLTPSGQDYNGWAYDPVLKRVLLYEAPATVNLGSPYDPWRSACLGETSDAFPSIVSCSDPTAAVIQEVPGPAIAVQTSRKWEDVHYGTCLGLDDPGMPWP